MSSPLPLLSVSVRSLVSFVFAEGDIEPPGFGSARVRSGILGHLAVRRMRPEGARFEVPLQARFGDELFELELHGRADALLLEGERIIVDEVKTTRQALAELEESRQHWAQVQLYGCLLAQREDLEELDLQLTYYQLETKEIREFRRTCSAAELSSFGAGLLAPYLSWMRRVVSWQRQRDASTEQLTFPHARPRPGQEELVQAALETIAAGGRLFVRAPTGIGKTAAVLYPAVRALGAGQISRLFYLTARTTGRSIAEKTLARMRESGLALRALTLTAKEKICPFPGTSCEAQSCARAAGHYGRVGQAISEAYEQQVLDLACIEKIADRHQVCPFEFSLDLALWVDAVICDYNYVFDPRVRLRRLFDQPQGEHALLVDEAHNLVDRGREMSSAELTKRAVLDLKRSHQASHPELAQALQAINRWFLASEKGMREEGQRAEVKPEPPADLLDALRAFLGCCEALLSAARPLPDRPGLLVFYFGALTFVRAAERFEPGDLTLIEGSKGRMRVKLYCVDPAPHLRPALIQAKATVFFSATLTPLPYYQHLLSGHEEDHCLCLPSPFDPENLRVLLAENISTTYRKRHLFYGTVARAIHALVSCRAGNYLAFFPSFAYLNAVYEHFAFLQPQPRLLLQQTRMGEADREAFLLAFADRSDDTLVGFAVLGGIFAEGIDLVGEELIGAAIVGIGLPQLCLERDLIRHHFDEELEAGWEYAYQYPGMTRVLQAAGRIIRGDDDRGVLLLIGERFAHSATQVLLPEEWPAPIAVSSADAVAAAVEEHWSA